jgi:hypothetical protein
MSYIRRFRQLQSRLIELEGHFLPVIKPAGNYTKKELDNTRAYCVLCHAEIEAFLEDIAIFKVNSAINSWVRSGKKRINMVVFYLATYCDKAPATKAVPPINLVHFSHLNFQNIVRANHGIKQNNLDNLFTKIGFDVDVTLASTLNSFGQQRGEVAHTASKTQTPIDPLTEKNRIGLIQTGLQALISDFSSFF